MIRDTLAAPVGIPLGVDAFVLAPPVAHSRDACARAPPAPLCPLRTPAGDETFTPSVSRSGRDGPAAKRPFSRDQRTTIVYGLVSC